MFQNQVLYNKRSKWNKKSKKIKKKPNKNWEMFSFQKYKIN